MDGPQGICRFCRFCRYLDWTLPATSLTSLGLAPLNPATADAVAAVVCHGRSNECVACCVPLLRLSVMARIWGLTAFFGTLHIFLAATPRSRPLPGRRPDAASCKNLSPEPGEGWRLAMPAWTLRTRQAQRSPPGPPLPRTNCFFRLASAAWTALPFRLVFFFHSSTSPTVVASCCASSRGYGVLEPSCG